MINLIKTTAEFQSYRKTLQSLSTGLVPTMGNLHEGHLSLVKASLQNNDLTIVTIFVNPLQFGPNEDLEKYPRTLEQDLEKLSTLSRQENKIIIFAPHSSEEIFPKDYQVKISLGDFTNKLCGRSRVGHFDGVLTVVHRLFSLSDANKCYFGQKDLQQFLAIKKMVTDLHLPIELKMIEISRDPDGLAMSSRNQYLLPGQRPEALHLRRTLKTIADLLQKKTYQESYIDLNKLLELELKVSAWDYLEVLDAEDLLEISEKTTKAAILGALKIGETRLIDNILVDIVYA